MTALSQVLRHNTYSIFLILFVVVFSLQEAVRREVLEESGLEFEAEAVLAVEHNTSALWTRVTFVGR